MKQLKLSINSIGLEPGEFIETFKQSVPHIKIPKGISFVASPEDLIYKEGQNTVVFQMKYQESLVALKCYLPHTPLKSMKRLSLIKSYLNKHPNPYFLDFELYISAFALKTKFFGLRDCDILLMPWIEGESLGSYAERCAKYQDGLSLQKLWRDFREMALFLLENDLAHGDLNHENILIDEDKNLKLVDYDAMYLPLLSPLGIAELGMPSYRHTEQTNAAYNRDLDDFSILLLSISLYALSTDPSLKIRYPNKQGILLDVIDIFTFTSSELLAELQNKGDIFLNQLLKEFTLSLSQKRPNIPHLASLLKMSTVENPEVYLLLEHRTENQARQALHENRIKSISTYLNDEWWASLESNVNENLLITVKLEDLGYKLPQMTKEEKLAAFGHAKKSILLYYQSIAYRHLIDFTQAIEEDTLYKISTLTWLNLSLTNFENYDFLNVFSEVLWLDLTKSTLTDFNALKGMIRLEKLILDHNSNIKDFAPLKHLPQLKTLSLKSCQLENLTSLKEVVQLKELDLSSNRIQNLSALAHFSELEYLSLKNNHIKNLQPIASINSLKGLHLGMNPIKDHSPLVTLNNLEILELSNQISLDCYQLSSLQNLKLLELNSNDDLKNIEALCQLTSLQSLNLSYSTTTEDLSVLRYMKSLRFLNLSYVKIKDFSFLEHLTTLEELYLVNNVKHTFFQKLYDTYKITAYLSKLENLKLLVIDKYLISSNNLSKLKKKLHKCTILN